MFIPLYILNNVGKETEFRQNSVGGMSSSMQRAPDLTLAFHNVDMVVEVSSASIWETEEVQSYLGIYTDRRFINVELP